MNIRIELSSLANTHRSGVANYTKLLTQSLDKVQDVNLRGFYFNFLNRQPIPDIDLNNPLEENVLIPLRLYAKSQSYHLAPPFDAFLTKVDLTIFPNFATWPTVHTKFKATVIHDLTYIHYPDAVESKNLEHLRRVVPCSINNADFIITVSETIKAEIVKELSMDPARCIVTPIPPDTTFFSKNTNEIHEKYNIPTQKYIFFTGNTEPRKNLSVLLSAYQKLPKKIRKEYSLVLAGSKGWKSDDIQQTIIRMRDAGENIIHVGFIDQQDIGAFYQKAGLFVMPSIYEGFGMPILEALASRIPVVASDIPVLHEVGGKAVLYADPSNSSDFTDKITLVLTSSSVRNKLLSKTDEQLSKFSWEKNATLIVKKVNELKARI